MNISIEIDDNALKTAVQEGIKGLSTETLEDLAKQAIAGYLSDKNTIEKLIFKESRYWGRDNYIDYNAPQEWFLELLERSYTEDETKKYRQMIFDTLQNNREKILIELFANAFSEVLINSDLRQGLGMLLSERFNHN